MDKKTNPVRRRDALGLAGAVAAFGAALGMSTSEAKAQDSKLKSSNAAGSQQQKVQSSQLKAQSSQLKAQSTQYKIHSSTGQTTR